MNEFYYWRSGTGHEVNLSRWPYQVISEDGLGGVDVDIYEHAVPLQDGTLYLGNVVRPRTFAVGIEIMGYTPEEVKEARTRLLHFLSAKWGLGALGRSFGGVRRESYCLPERPPRFQSGAGEDLGFQDIVTFKAMDPAFYDPDEREVAAGLADQTDLVFPITFPIRFGSDVIVASPIATVYGDWPVFPIIVLTGPLGSPVVNNLTTGEQLDFSGNGGLDLATGEAVTIDLRPGVKTAEKQDGTNVVPYLTTDSDLLTFHLAPPPPDGDLGEAPWQMGVEQEAWATDGENELTLWGADATSDSSITVQWNDRYSGI